MSQWSAKDVAKCSLCGTTRRTDSLTEGRCQDAEWCLKQRAIPEAITSQWIRIQDDLNQMGSAGFEVAGRKYVLYGVSDTAQTWASALEESLDE